MVITIHNPQKRLRTQTLQKQAEWTIRLLAKNWPKKISCVDIYLVGEKMISRLHGQFLNDPTPTDVITFHHGEIFICPSVAEKQRKATGLSLHDEVLTYIIHGLLHLCGWDDHSEKKFGRMKKKQESILKTIVK